MTIIRKISQLKGGEILARQVLTDDYQLLLESGETIQERHVQRLKDLGIEELYVLEENSDEKKVEIIKEETFQNITKRIEALINKTKVNSNPKYKEVAETANEVIEEVLSIESLSIKVFDMRERSKSIYEHVTNVCSTSVLIALLMNETKEKVHDIAVGSLLHEIGLEEVDSYYFNKDLSMMTQLEQDEYKKHPALGYSKLMEEKWLSDTAKLIVLNHHEKMDGSGFPQGSILDNIEVNIVQVCDVFDEMFSGIGCLRAKNHEVIEYLKVNKGKKLNEEVVDKFLSVIAVYPVGTIVLTSEGEVAVVIRQNRNFTDRPVLKILKDKNGKVKEGLFVKDLLQENTVFIEQEL